MNRRVLAIVALVTTLAVWAGTVRAEQRLLQRSLPASSLEVIELLAGDGSIEVGISHDDQVRVEVEVTTRPGGGEGAWEGVKRWFLESRLEDDRELLETIELSTKEDSGRLVVRPLPRGSTVQDRIEEKWSVRVPSRLALDLRANSARVKVHGLAGGVRLRQGHGDVEVRVPSGDLDLQLQVGSIEASSGADGYRSIALASEVGKTRLFQGERRMKYANPPGPGSFVSLEGSGSDEIRIEVQVGDAELRLGD